jgi:hypothetical protein
MVEVYVDCISYSLVEPGLVLRQRGKFEVKAGKILAN